MQARIERKAHVTDVVIEEDYGKPFTGHVGQTVLTLAHSQRGAMWHCRAIINGQWRVMPAYFAEDHVRNR